MTALPIEPVLPEIADSLRRHRALVLQAPPGAGKTTLVPLSLLDAPWLAGRKIVMLEPRRLATRAAARRMADLLGEKIGERVGYRVRLDTRVGPRTRIEVVTDGVFTRLIQADPELAGIGLVIFDEFHERSLDNDLGLALSLEAQAALREDLKLLVMSATLDGEAVAGLLGGAPIVSSEGRAFPVATRHLDRPAPNRFVDAVAAAIRQALAEESGDILAFLPGAGEIRRVQGRLRDVPARVLPLYGDLPQAAQDEALRPAADGGRRIVLATSIAETSLTIEGVRIVVDGGQMRVPRFDPRTGMTRLDTIPVSQASSEQRRGRAGRLEPGVCYRLWPDSAQRALVPFTAPEILAADLAPLALELARWGEDDPSRLAWLDAPPSAAFAQAQALLRRLGALDESGRITAHGRELAGLGVHPRLAHMMLAGRALGFGDLAADLAALLGERDPLRGVEGGGDADLRLRLALVRGEERAGAADAGVLRRIREQARQYRRRLGIDKGAASSLDRAGLALALAYPDRIAQLRPGGERQYLLSGGSGAYFRSHQPLAAESLLAVADLDGERSNAEIYSAAPVQQAELESAFADSIESVERVEWVKRDRTVMARRQRRLGALVLKEERLDKPPRDALTAALLAGLRDLGLGVLAWSKEAAGWRARIGFMRRLEGEDWPDLSDETLLATLEEWLAPHLADVMRFEQLRAFDPVPILQVRLDWPQRRRLDSLAPTHWTVPSGSHLPIDYAGAAPVLAVRLQEMFGATETPAIAGGRVPLLLHLLSPAQRPMQVTSDLVGFWRNTYPQVRAELRGQYPKHSWPDNPLTAPPTARAKRRGTS